MRTKEISIEHSPLQQEGDITKRLVVLYSEIETLIFAAQNKSSYIKKQDDKWKQRHFAIRWNIFLKEVHQQFLIILAHPLFMNAESKDRLRIMSVKAKNMTFTYFCKKIEDLSFKVACFSIQLNHYVSKMEPGVRKDAAFTWNDFLEKAIQTLNKIYQEQEEWAKIPH